MGKFQQRDAITSPDMCPPWLCGYNTNAEKFMYCIGLGLDGLLEKQNEGMLAKLPGQADASCIPLQAADRLLVQGPSETNGAFILRLLGAFPAWARAGSRNASLAQLQAYLTDLQPGIALEWPEMLIVGGNTSISTWNTIFGSTPQGDPSARYAVSPANWNWDGQDKPSRAWLILFMNLVDTGPAGGFGAVASTSGGFATLTGLENLDASKIQKYITVQGAASAENNGVFQIQSVPSDTSLVIANPNAVAPDANNDSLVWVVGEYPYIGPSPVWGSPSFEWGLGTWGLNCSPLVIQSLRAILKRWKGGATDYPRIIVSFGGQDGTAGKEFSPLSAQGAGNPDGTWGSFGKNVNGVWVPAKEPLNPFTAFCDGTALAVQCYEKNIG